MKQVCYCADDFAMNSEISFAVLELIQKNLIHATSCMTQSPRWAEDAQKLCALNNTFDIGLHLNFTEKFHENQYTFPLSKLILKAWTHTLDHTKVENCIQEQWNLFVNATGKHPDFIDGHQHIHQFPIIREILFNFLRKQNFKGWLRSLNHPLSAVSYQRKTMILKLLGAKKFNDLCDQFHLNHNKNFAGIYDFQILDYAKLNQEWLSQAETGLLVMCHPAHTQNHSQDPIQNARIQEFNYLNSEQFLADCEKFNVQLKPIGAIL